MVRQNAATPTLRSLMIYQRRRSRVRRPHFSCVGFGVWVGGRDLGTDQAGEEGGFCHQGSRGTDTSRIKPACFSVRGYCTSAVYSCVDGVEQGVTGRLLLSHPGAAVNWQARTAVVEVVRTKCPSAVSVKRTAAQVPASSGRVGSGVQRGGDARQRQVGREPFAFGLRFCGR